MDDNRKPEQEALEHERAAFLHELEDWLEGPMIGLAFLWLVLLIVELIWGLSPLLETLAAAIWIIFILDFLLRFIAAPRKVAYLRGNWLTALSLFLPALRIFRFAQTLRLLRVARATRGLRLVRVVSSLNRGMRALKATMGRRGFRYVVLLTLIILLVGAAGMYALEDEGFESYGDALWWTAMLLTTVGSEYWPQTAEGRVLCLLLSIYSLGILGYVTAVLASFFIGRDAEDEAGELPSAKAVEALRAENEALRAEVHQLLQRS